MPIDTPHPAYSAMLPRWRAWRDAALGEYAVKQGGSGRLGTPTSSGAFTYLPRPAGMLDEDYRAYVARAKWYGATARTVQGLTGAILRKPPAMGLPPAMEAHLADITLTGLPLLSLLAVLLEEIFLMGRFGLLVDYTREGADGRPLWSAWSAEQMPLWLIDTTANALHLRAVVLTEEVERARPDDPFQLERVTQYRLHALSAEGIYTITLYEMGPRGLRPVSEPLIPRRRQEPLRFVPFQFFAPLHLSPAVSPSPLADLIAVNYANYRHSADYEHGLHLTALPTAVITGFKDDNTTLAIGSQAVWQIFNPDARVFFLEFQGAGLTSHIAAMDTDKREMATLGARLLEAAPDVQETLGAVRLRQSGEQGALAAWAQVAAQGVQQCLQWHAWWMGETENPADPAITFGFNTDFAPQPLAAQEMVALMQVWQGGGISLDTFLWNLQQGERLPPGREIEQEKALIEAQAPALVPDPTPAEDIPPTQEAA